MSAEEAGRRRSDCPSTSGAGGEAELRKQLTTLQEQVLLTSGHGAPPCACVM
jgi:hypothetical protein